LLRAPIAPLFGHRQRLVCPPVLPGARAAGGPHGRSPRAAGWRTSRPPPSSSRSSRARTPGTPTAVTSATARSTPGFAARSISKSATPWLRASPGLHSTAGSPIRPPGLPLHAIPRGPRLEARGQLPAPSFLGDASCAALGPVADDRFRRRRPGVRPLRRGRMSAFDHGSFRPADGSRVLRATTCARRRLAGGIRAGSR
jgi:hypothetical protein